MFQKRRASAGGVLFTQHAEYKMREYRLSRQKVSSVMRRPEREEVGIVPDTIAAMQTIGSSKRSHEVWVMYQKRKKAGDKQYVTMENRTLSHVAHISTRVISAWRYPGKSPERDPIPEHILRGIEDAISSNV